MVFPELADFLDWALLLLRIITGVVFFSSGWSHVTQPAERAESIGMSKPATFILGFAEVVASVAVIIGIYTQIAAMVLVIVMLGAIGKKIFVWKKGFYAEEGFGWHYDSLLLTANLVFITTGGGAFVLI